MPIQHSCFLKSLCYEVKRADDCICVRYDLEKKSGLWLCSVIGFTIHLTNFQEFYVRDIFWWPFLLCCYEYEIMEGKLFCKDSNLKFFTITHSLALLTSVWATLVFQSDFSKKAVEMKSLVQLACPLWKRNPFICLSHNPSKTVFMSKGALLISVFLANALKAKHLRNGEYSLTKANYGVRPIGTETFNLLGSKKPILYSRSLPLL